MYWKYWKFLKICKFKWNLQLLSPIFKINLSKTLSINLRSKSPYLTGGALSLTWRYLSCRAAGLCSMICEASLRALLARISPSAAITLALASRLASASAAWTESWLWEVRQRRDWSYHGSLELLWQPRVLAAMESLIIRVYSTDQWENRESLQNFKI